MRVVLNRSFFIKKAAFLVTVTLFLMMYIGVANAAIAPFPEKFGGTVMYTDASPVEWDAIEAYMDGVKRGELLKSDPYLGTYTPGQYGLPLNDLVNVKKLLVNCPENQTCTNKLVTFKVIVGGISYTATTNPAEVKWATNVLKQVDLKIPVIQTVGVKGSVFLEKVNSTDVVNHQGTEVKVTQGATVVTGTSNSNGYYEVTGLAAGDCSVEFDNPSGSWKKETRTATVGASGLTQVSDATLYIGDMNADAAINILDLLWMASKIGPVDPSSQLADVNKDSQVNILDLLRVAQNIGK